MELESRNVFIDTQSFVKLGLNFNHPALQAFLELCEEKKLCHLTTSVVKREVETKIQLSIQEALNSLQSFRRKARLLEKIKDKNIKALFEEIDEEEVHKKSMSVFKNFLYESKSKILTALSINTEEILELYFDKKPPFGEGKKKSEFPDAISLYSLLQEIGDDKAYVISDDPDMKKFCETNTSLINVETLDKFLDLYNEHESTITELIKMHLSTIETHIKTEIEQIINESWAYNEATWEDSIVDEFRVIKVHEINPTVISIDEKECYITFDIDVDIEYTVTGPDSNGGIYGKEEGRLYTFGSTTHNGSTTKTFTVELGYSYHLDDGRLKNIIETEFNIEGLSDGFAIYVEESDET